MVIETPPPDFNDAYTRVHRLWHWTLISPILYLILARLMMDFGWVETFPLARHPMDQPSSRWLLGAVAAAMLGAVVWLHLRRGPAVRSLSDDPPQALRRWILYFYIMVAMSDAVTFISLVYFILSGHIWIILAGGAGTYAGYALAYPIRRELDE